MMRGPFQRWDGASKRNGELLALAAAEFDVFLTADRNLSYQQDVSSFDIAVVVLVAPSNSIEDLRPLEYRIADLRPFGVLPVIYVPDSPNRDAGLDWTGISLLARLAKKRATLLVVCTR